jgi:hypothetical protein
MHSYNIILIDHHWKRSKGIGSVADQVANPFWSEKTNLLCLIKVWMSLCVLTDIMTESCWCSICDEEGDGLTL